MMIKLLFSRIIKLVIACFFFKGGGGGGGGVQGKFFWRIRFKLWAPQVPLIIGKTFGEVLGPSVPNRLRATPRPKNGRKIVISPRWS